MRKLLQNHFLAGESSALAKKLRWHVWAAAPRVYDDGVHNSHNPPKRFSISTVLNAPHRWKTLPEQTSKKRTV
jgi:hypothetical protein